jgi:hypothetical protein
MCVRCSLSKEHGMDPRMSSASCIKKAMLPVIGGLKNYSLKLLQFQEWVNYFYEI